MAQIMERKLEPVARGYIAEQRDAAESRGLHLHQLARAGGERMRDGVGSEY